MDNFSLLERIGNAIIINASLLPSIGLSNGKIACAMAAYKLYKHTNNSVYEETADELIDMVFDEINLSMPVGFYSGVTGIGCGIEYIIQQKFVDADSNEILEDLDETVFQTDRNKYKYAESTQEFFGTGWYYLMRAKNNNNLETDFQKFATYILTDELPKSEDVSNSFLISLLGVVFKTRHLFPESLINNMVEYVDKKLDRENIDIVSEYMLGKFVENTEYSALMQVPGMKKLKGVDLVTACFNFACYNLAFPEITNQIKPYMSEELNNAFNCEDERDILFSNIGLIGLAGYTFILI